MTDPKENPGYEKSDVSVNKIIIWGVLAVILLIVFVVFIMDYYVATKERLIYEKVLTPPSAALRELRARETEILNSYKILDSTQGVYRIPIDRAMQILADDAHRTETPDVKN